MQDYRNITGYIWFYFDYILPYFSPFFTPKTLISQKLLIVDTWNHSHWIRNGKVEISGQCDIFDLADVPPPPQGITKLRSQVNMTFWFWWSARLVNGLEHHPPPLSSQKNEMLGFFGLRSTSDDRPGWSMDSNTICHPSPAKKSEMLIFSTAVCSRQRCLTNHYP